MKGFPPDLVLMGKLISDIVGSTSPTCDIANLHITRLYSSNTYVGYKYMAMNRVALDSSGLRELNVDRDEIKVQNEDKI